MEEEKKTVDAERLKQLLADGKDWDPDRMYMSANDLSDWISSDKIKKSEDIDQVIDILIYQLNYKQTDLQGNAIRCMSKIMPKLNFDQTKKVSDIMIRKVIEKQQEFRDVYGTCIISLVNEVPHDYFEAMKSVLELSIKEFYKQENIKEKDELNIILNIKEELLDIIQCILKRWSVYFKNSPFNKKELIESLIHNIIKMERQSLRRKSSNTLGTITMVLNLDDIKKIIKTLIEEINKCQHRTSEIKNQIMYLVQALDGISRATSTTFDESTATMVLDMAMQETKHFLDYFQKKQECDFDEVVNVSQVMELYLKIISQVVQCCPSFVTKKQNEIEELATTCLEFDPLNPPGSLFGSNQDKMENEEELDDEFDDDNMLDDLSWRVRKAGIQVIETFLKTKTEMMVMIYEKHFFVRHEQKPSLIKHLSENNENIRSAVIQIIQEFVKTLTTREQESQQDSIETDYVYTIQATGKQTIKTNIKTLDVNQVIICIMMQIKNILNNPKSSSNIRVQIFKLIENLVRSVNRYILQDPSTFKFTYEQILYALDLKQSNELKLAGLVCLKYLFKYNISMQLQLNHIRHEVMSMLKYIPSIISKADFYKIISESFKVINVLFYIIDNGLKEFLPEFKEHIDQIIPIILQRLQANNLDLEIKQSVILCASSLIINLGTSLKNEEKMQILQSIYEKLKIETKKVTILKLFQRLPINQFTNMDKKFNDLVHLIIKEIIQYIPKEDRIQNLASLEALKNLMKVQEFYQNIFDDSIKSEMLQNLIKKIKATKEMYITQLCLSNILQVMKTTTTVFKEYEQLQAICTELILTSYNIQANYNAILEINQILVKLKILNPEKYIEELFSYNKKECIHSMAAIISNLIKDLPNDELAKFLQKFQTQAIGTTQGESIFSRQLSLVIIGEYGKMKNITDNKTIFEQIMFILQNKNEKGEDIKYYASQCLGGISQGNLDVSIKTISSVIQKVSSEKQSTELYYYLNALKEIILIAKPQQLASQAQEIFNLLLQICENNEESIKNIIAECIGKLQMDNLALFKGKIIELAGQQSANLKYIMISAIKHIIKKGAEVTPDHKEILSKYQSFLADKDLNVRLAALKTFGIISYNQINAISEILDRREFYDMICVSLRQFQIREIELGPFKHKIDDAASIRAQAFQLVEIIISSSNKFEQYEAEIIKEIIQNLSAEIQDEIKTLRFSILTKISQRAFAKLIPFIKNIVQELSKIVDTLQKNKEQDKIQDIVKNLLMACYTINQSVDVEKQELFNDWIAFYNTKLLSNQQYKKMLDEITNP